VANILLVEDEELIREMLTEALETEGHKVQIAVNGREAVNNYVQERVDLVITDIIMPEQEGIETIMQLRKANPQVKIIAMSGGGRTKGDDYLALAKKLGAKHTFAKPLDVHEFLTAVAATLNS
jgi:DNA-binding response OmpR family regulator